MYTIFLERIKSCYVRKASDRIAWLVRLIITRMYVMALPSLPWSSTHDTHWEQAFPKQSPILNLLKMYSTGGRIRKIWIMKERVSVYHPPFFIEVVRLQSLESGCPEPNSDGSCCASHPAPSRRLTLEECEPGKCLHYLLQTLVHPKSSLLFDNHLSLNDTKKLRFPSQCFLVSNISVCRGNE